MMNAPLPERLRPKSLEEYIGQEHLVGEGKPLRLAIESKHKFSFILWGPPGVGKTTLARIYAASLGMEFHELSAVAAGKDDMRAVMDGAHGDRLLFVDEIHRFNKAQQDYLLPFVERGDILLIGATTENPSFEVIAPLLSRLRVFVLKELTEENMKQIIVKAEIPIDVEASDWLIAMANGDARQLLSMLEATVDLYKTVTVDNLKNTLQAKFLRYDKQGEEHYNTISAFIKSMRASNPNAAVYYLARMVESGEDPLFIARRMVIFASEDIGMAQPTALVVANEVFRACETIGYPECAINLAHGVIYLASSSKNREAYEALRAAQAEIAQSGNLPIPLELRNAPTKLMKEFNYGKGYEKYTNKDLLPDQIKGKLFYSKKN